MRILIALVALSSMTVPLIAQRDTPPVTVSPNLRLLPGEHNEPWIAVSPTNPDVMIAVSQQGAGNATSPRWAVTTAISRDGGRTWAPVNLPDPAQTPFDPMVAAGPDGRLYVMHGVIGGDFLEALGISSPHKPTIRFWSSGDEGFSWDGPTDLAASVPPDHMRMAIDMSNGPHRGRIYIEWNDVADQFVRDQYEVFLQYSDDFGKTFTDPILVATDTDGKLVATEPVILSDGTLLVTWYQYFNPLARAENEQMPFYIRRSTDGGMTFSPPEKIFEFGPHVWRHRVGEFSRAFSLPIVTADTSSQSSYRDRIYVTWDDVGNGKSNVWFVKSTDRGRTWSRPLRINDNQNDGPLGVPDFRNTPVVAAAPNGDVGILWYDRRDDPTRQCWNLYFALSRDGGESFSSNQRITTAQSCPPPTQAPAAIVHNLSPVRRDPNTPPDSLVARMSLVQRLGILIAQENRRARDEANRNLSDARLTVSFDPGRNMFPGHYTGLAADRNGTFHGLWLDRRNGTQELYTARIAAGGTAMVPGGASTNVTTLVEVVAAAPSYDPATGTVTIQVQVRNVSQDVIYGPIALRIHSVSEVSGMPSAELADSTASLTDDEGFSFAGKLGSGDRLEPGDISEPIEIAIRVRPETGLDAALDLRVTGVLSGTGGR